MSNDDEHNVDDIRLDRETELEIENAALKSHVLDLYEKINDQMSDIGRLQSEIAQVYLLLERKQRSDSSDDPF